MRRSYNVPWVGQPISWFPSFFNWFCWSSKHSFVSGSGCAISFDICVLLFARGRSLNTSRNFPKNLAPTWTSSPPCRRTTSRSGAAEIAYTNAMLAKGPVSSKDQRLQFDIKSLLTLSPFPLYNFTTSIFLFHCRHISLLLHVLEARQVRARSQRGRLQRHVLQQVHRPQDYPRLLYMHQGGHLR